MPWRLLVHAAGSRACGPTRCRGAPIGLLSKVILEVLRKESGKSWENAMRGQTLASGDMVRTGPKSLAIIKFKDNSLVRFANVPS